jgi:hypothetical protein
MNISPRLRVGTAAVLFGAVASTGLATAASATETQESAWPSTETQAPAEVVTPPQPSTSTEPTSPSVPTEPSESGKSTAPAPTASASVTPQPESSATPTGPVIDSSPAPSPSPSTTPTPEPTSEPSTPTSEPEPSTSPEKPDVKFLTALWLVPAGLTDDGEPTYAQLFITADAGANLDAFDASSLLKCGKTYQVDVFSNENGDPAVLWEDKQLYEGEGDKFYVDHKFIHTPECEVVPPVVPPTEPPVVVPPTEPPVVTPPVTPPAPPVEQCEPPTLEAEDGSCVPPTFYEKPPVEQVVVTPPAVDEVDTVAVQPPVSAPSETGSLAYTGAAGDTFIKIALASLALATGVALLVLGPLWTRRKAARGEHVAD